MKETFVGNSPSTAVQVNPLVGDLQTVAIADSEAAGGTREVQGRPIAPGLALTPAIRSQRDKNDRYSVTHLPTGLRVGGRCCGLHVQEVAAIAASSGVDWTLSKEPLMAAIREIDGLVGLLDHLCLDWCDGDGPQPPAWLVRCRSCDWQLDDEDSEPALTAADAKAAADEHECEPEVEIRHPETGKWHAEWLVNRDGSVHDLTAAKR